MINIGINNNKSIMIKVHKDKNYVDAIFTSEDDSNAEELIQDLDMLIGLNSSTITYIRETKMNSLWVISLKYNKSTINNFMAHIATKYDIISETPQNFEDVGVQNDPLVIKIINAGVVEENIKIREITFIYESKRREYINYGYNGFRGNSNNK